MDALAVAWEGSATGITVGSFSHNSVSMQARAVFADGVLGLRALQTQYDVNGTIMISPGPAPLAADSLIPWAAGEV